jgi:hypothetical protein
MKTAVASEGERYPGISGIVKISISVWRKNTF